MTETSTAPPPATTNVRIPPQYFCQFTAIGVVVTPPTFSTTRNGKASATFAIRCQDDRILDLLMFDNDLPALTRRLHLVSPGATLHAQGAIRPPRPTHREFHIFIAERVTVINASSETRSIDGGTSDSNRQPA